MPGIPPKPLGNLHVRRLDAADAAAYRALRLRALQEHPQAFTSSFEEESPKPLSVAEQRLSAGAAGKFWGAFDGDTLVGMVGLDRESRQKNRHKATVVAMYVAEEYAGRGAGAALMNALLLEAKASAIELLVLTVTRGNAAARHLYDKLGFTCFGVEPGAIRVHQQAFDKEHMFLLLRPHH